MPNQMPSQHPDQKPDTIIIRDAEENDLRQVLAIYGHHVLNGLASFEETPPDLEEFTERFRAIKSKDLPYVVAQNSHGNILGYAYAGPYRTRPAYRHTVENSVYTAPDAARQGLGRRLLSRVIEHCESLGWVHQMIGVIGDSGNAGSIGLHKALGFEYVGTLKGTGFKHGRWVDTVMTQRAINAGDTASPDLD